ncbi:unnamed protein product [Boreogadus saida]
MVKQRVADVENLIQCVADVEGKRLDVEDAKQCGESPMKASKSVENKKQCGKNQKDAILGVENGRQKECIVQKEGNNAVKESAETVEAGPIPAAAEGCSGSEEDTVCKPPILKRKQGSETCGSKAKKAAASGEQEEQIKSVSSDEQAEVQSSEEEEMEDGATDIKAQMSIRGEGGFSEQEVYRLKKIALRLKQELHAEDYV